jgi:hypothetical protein
MRVSGQRHALATFYPLWKDPWYPLDRRLGWPQSRSQHRDQTRGSQSEGPPSGGSDVGRVGGSSCLYEGHVSFEWNMGARYNIHFGTHFAWLTWFTYYLVLVLAHLSPAKVRRMLLISWSSCQICLFEFILVEGGVNFMKHFKTIRERNIALKCYMHASVWFLRRYFQIWLLFIEIWAP